MGDCHGQTALRQGCYGQYLCPNLPKPLPKIGASFGMKVAAWRIVGLYCLSILRRGQGIGGVVRIVVRMPQLGDTTGSGQISPGVPGWTKSRTFTLRFVLDL